MNDRGVILKEIETLREDLRELKKCQVQYFSLSITGTGGILGLAAILNSSPLKGLALLAPLVIILPCWLIFFDKATTITRTVGYQRILERCIKNEDQGKYVYRGYENALADYRHNELRIWQEINAKPKPDKPSMWRMLILETRHRYWMINWYTFALLSFLCCASYLDLRMKEIKLILPFGVQITAPERSLWGGIAFTLAILCAIYTFRMVVSLTQGQYSYDVCTLIWEEVLSTRNTT